MIGEIGKDDEIFLEESYFVLHARVRLVLRAPVCPLTIHAATQVLISALDPRI